MTRVERGNYSCWGSGGGCPLVAFLCWELIEPPWFGGGKMVRRAVVGTAPGREGFPWRSYLSPSKDMQ